MIAKCWLQVAILIYCLATYFSLVNLLFVDLATESLAFKSLTCSSSFWILIDSDEVSFVGECTRFGCDAAT